MKKAHTFIDLWKRLVSGIQDFRAIQRKMILSLISAGVALGCPTGLGADLAPSWTFLATDGIYSDSVYASPCLGRDGTVYFLTVGVWAGNFPMVFAVNPASQTAKWQYAIGDQTRVWSSPVLTPDDSTLYVTSDDGILRALNTSGANPGSLNWRFPAPGQTITGPIHCSPAIGKDGTVYYATHLTDINTKFHWYLVALTPSGSLKWQWPTDNSQAILGEVFGNPAIGADGTVYLVSNLKQTGGGGFLYAFTDNGSNGSLKWQFPNGPAQFGPANWVVIDQEGTIYFGTHTGFPEAGGTHLWAVNPDGTQRWTVPFGVNGGSFDSSAAFGSDGTIYVGADADNSATGTLFAVKPDGTQKWAWQNPNAPPSGLVSSFESSPAVAADGTIYIGCNDCRVYALGDNGTSAALKWQSIQSGTDHYGDPQFPESGFESSPIIATDGSMLYIGCWDKKLYAFSQNNGGPANSFWPAYGENRRHSSDVVDNRWTELPFPSATIIALQLYNPQYGGTDWNVAYAVNSVYRIAGGDHALFQASWNEHMVNWLNNSVSDMSALAQGKDSEGDAINDSNLVVGWGIDSSGVQRAVWNQPGHVGMAQLT